MDNTDNFVPCKVKLKYSIEQFSSGSNFIACVTTGEQLLVFGENNRLGGYYDHSPNKILQKDVSLVNCGENHYITLHKSNNSHSIYSVGLNDNGQLGVDSNYCTVGIPTNIKIYGIDTVIQLNAGGNSSSVIITEDTLEILIAASQKLYGIHDICQKQKMINIIKADPLGSLQKSARKVLRLTNRSKHKHHHHHHSSQLSSSAPLLRSTSRLSFTNDNNYYLGNYNDKKHFEWKLHSSIYSIGISKYHLFEKVTNTMIYKYLCDEILIINAGYSNANFEIELPKSNNFKLNATPMFGNIGKDGQNIQFQLLTLTQGIYEELISITIKNDELIYCHYLYFFIDCKAQVHVPEYNIEDLKGGKKLGSGAAGTVSKVNLNGKDVAVKLFDGMEELSIEDINSFRNEMMISSNLSHPNIVDCLGVCTQFPHLALVLEYLPLKDLRNIIDNNPKQLEIEFILRISIDIVEGMIYLHNRMVMHRDLKPDNVLIVSTNVNDEICAKLTDFGTSCVVSNKNNNAEVGTARYMPLEVLDPDPNSKFDRRMIDVYSFGISKLFLFLF